MNCGKKEQLIEASCHCGNIRVAVKALPSSVTSCNCSICRRIAPLWGYYSLDEIEIKADKTSLSHYQWGDKMIYFHHCNNCGCVTHYSPVEGERAAVNFRMFSNETIKKIKVKHFDGADSWTFIDNNR